MKYNFSTQILFLNIYFPIYQTTTPQNSGNVVILGNICLIILVEASLEGYLVSYSWKNFFIEQHKIFVLYGGELLPLITYLL